MERQSHDLSELFFFESFFLINLISEHDNRYILQLWHLKKSFELFFGLSKSINISGIYDEDYSVDSTCILSPCFSCLHMASQIIGIEFYRSDCDLSLMWMYSGISLGEFVALKHVEHSRFSSVIKPKEYYVSALLEESKPFKSRLEEIINEHISFS